MAFTTGNDINILQATDSAIVGAGAGNDKYILSPSGLTAGQSISISDTLGANTLQLIGGLTITSSKVGANVIQLTLSNGGIVNILGANNFSFELGGNPLTGTAGTIKSFTEFATTSLGLTAVPTGSTVADGTANVGVNSDGTTTAGGSTTPVNSTALTSSMTETLNGTSASDNFTGVLSATDANTTYHVGDAIMDTSTTDADTFTLTVEKDVTSTNSGSVRNIETILVNVDAVTALGAAVPIPADTTTLDFDATNFSGVKEYKFDVTKAITAITGLNVAALGSNNATVTASTDFTTIDVATVAVRNVTVDAKAVGSAGVATVVGVTGGTTGNVTVQGAGYLTATVANSGVVTVTAEKAATVNAAAATVILADAKGGKLTVGAATAAVVMDLKATGDITVASTGGGSVKAVAGGTVVIATTAALSANLSSVGSSEINGGAAIAALTLSGNGAAATYTVAAAQIALTDVTVTGANNVTLKVASESAAGSLNVYDTTTAGIVTVEISGASTAAVDLSKGDKVDVLKVTGAATHLYTVVNGQEITYTASQAAALVAVGSASSAATNAVTIKLDDAKRDASAVNLTGITITQAKTVTIDASIDATATGTASASSIGGINASVANANVTINTGINGMTLTGINTVGTGTLTITGSGAVKLDTAATLAAAALDASAVTGAVTTVTTFSTAGLSSLKTGSGNDVLDLANVVTSNLAIATGSGNDTVTLATGISTANAVTSIDLGEGTADTLKFQAGTQLVKGTTGSVSLSGVETIQFAGTATPAVGQQIQASLLSAQTYSVVSAGTLNASFVAVIVAPTDTVVNLSTLVGSAAAATSIELMTFVTDANANTAGIAITGVSAAKNTITGSAFADVLTGGAKADTFAYALAGNLFHTDGTMIDTIVGGAGIDAIQLTAADALTVAIGSNWATLSSVEKITAGASAAAITLNLNLSAQTAGITAVDLSGDITVGGSNVVNAAAFTSGITMTGSIGPDTLTGGSGNDTFVVTATSFSNDTIVGGAGTDVLSVGVTGTAASIVVGDLFTNISSVETIKAVANTAAVDITLAAGAYTSGIRTVDLSLVTAAAANKIDIGAFTGADAITLIGSATGKTTITGGAGNDIISGGSANDIFAGGAGFNQISLAAGGNDTVTLSAATGHATITGFTAGPIATAGYDILTAGALTGTDFVNAVAIASSKLSLGKDQITEINIGFTGTGLSAQNDGSALFSALKAQNLVADVATAVVLEASTFSAGVATAAFGAGYIVAYQAGNAYVYSYDSTLTKADGTSAVADAVIDIADIHLLATLTGVAVGDLATANFTALV